jgi:hypothetical protein
MPVPLLEGNQEYVDDEGIDPAVAALHDRIDVLERKLSEVKRDAVIAVLNLLARSLKHVASGEFDLDEMAVAAAAPSTSNGKWEFWKKRYPGRIAETIDLLLIQGEMNQSQLCSALKCDSRTLSAKVIYPLNKAGLLIKNGGMFSLKRL